MKIGVMTFWWSEDNYGQILQCYALQKYLRDQGHDAYLIRYDPRNDYIPTPLPVKLLKALNPVKLYAFIHRKVNQKKIIREQKEHPRKFSEFRDRYIKQSERIYYSWQELRDDPPEADMYIVGSDQVWGLGHGIKNISNYWKSFLLDFGYLNTKRIAYAISFGTETIDSISKNLLAPYLMKFDSIFVREKSGCVICEACQTKAQMILDPTLLHKPEVYRTLYNTNPTYNTKKPYVLIYYLGNTSSVSDKIAIKWAKKNDYGIEYISANNNVCKINKKYATIYEWLSLVDKADSVITNSYHCIIFSILFQKKFGWIPLSGRFWGAMNTRVESLLEMIGLPEENIKLSNNNFDKILSQQIDYEKIANKLLLLRNENPLMKYLE